MGINLTEISQKVLDTVSNASNVFRKMYDLHYNPNPIDVPMEYIDENGQKRTTNVPNVAKFRKRVWDDVGGALGQFDRTFYVDQQNGDDNNEGTSRDKAFRSLQKVFNTLPIGGVARVAVIGEYRLKAPTDYQHKKTGEYCDYNKTVFLEISSRNDAKLVFESGTFTHESGALYQTWGAILLGSQSALRIFLVRENDNKQSYPLIEIEDSAESFDAIYPEQQGGIGYFSGHVGFVSVSVLFMNFKGDSVPLIEVGKNARFFFRCNWNEYSQVNTSLHIEGHYNALYMRLKTGAKLASFYRAGHILSLSVNLRLIDESDSGLEIADVLEGVIRDTNGVPRNVVSNIVL